MERVGRVLRPPASATGFSMIGRSSTTSSAKTRRARWPWVWYSQSFRRSRRYCSGFRCQYRPSISSTTFCRSAIRSVSPGLFPWRNGSSTFNRNRPAVGGWVFSCANKNRSAALLASTSAAATAVAVATNAVAASSDKPSVVSWLGVSAGGGVRPERSGGSPVPPRSLRRSAHTPLGRASGAGYRWAVNATYSASEATMPTASFGTAAISGSTDRTAAAKPFGSAAGRSRATSSVGQRSTGSNSAKARVATSGGSTGGVGVPTNRRARTACAATAGKSARGCRSRTASCR